MSSSGGRPVRVEVARVGGRRDVVFQADALAADEHEVPKDAASKGCGWPAALTLDVDPTWRSGYYEVVMEIDVGEKVRRDYAFFVVRPEPGTACIVLALATNTWHAYNDFGGPNLYNGGTQVAMQRPMAAGYLYKPPGKGRRVTGTGRTRPAERGARRLHPAQPSLGVGRLGRMARLGAALHRVGRARRLRGRRVHERRPRTPSRSPGRRPPLPLGRTRRVLVQGHARHRRGLRRTAVATRRSSRATRRCGRCASRGRTAT